ncbi:MAG: hypothetical protein ACRCW1_11880, partial [Anaerotignaceae bacterium]
VCSGPFATISEDSDSTDMGANKEGIIKEINTTKGSVTVILHAFGRETPVELDYTQLEKI